MSHVQTTPTETTVEQNTGTADFGEKDGRKDAMADRIEDWIAQLADATGEAVKSDEFQEWMDVQSKFHDYSVNNTLLIKMQCPEATKVAGYNTWKNEFGRYVKKGESAIWIWGPIITNRCPECENAESYHNEIGCEYDETDPDEWDEGLVGFRPVSVFDVSQTEGEPLPELETAAYGDPGDLIDSFKAVAKDRGFGLEIVDGGDWSHGSARGVSNPESGDIQVLDRENEADKLSTIIHEIAHSILHSGVSETVEREKREVEAEATAYVIGRYFDLDMSNSAFYLASWAGDDPEVIRSRLDRISQTAQDLIEAVEGSQC